MAQQTPVYRKAALDRLASPEQLDLLVTVSDGRGWLALLAVFLLILAVAVWSTLGSIPTNVQAQGILMTKGGKVSDAMTTAAGVLRGLEVNTDQMVVKDQILVRIEQTGLQQQLDHAREVVAEKQSDHDRLQGDFDREIGLRRANFHNRQSALAELVAATERRREYLERTLSLMEKSGKKGYTSKQKIEETRTEISRVQQEIATAKNDILKLDADALELSARWQRALSSAENAVSEAQRRVREKEIQLEQVSVVRAPVAGRVTEIKISDGDVVFKGQAVLSIEHAGEGLQVIAFVPTEHGKKLRSGMSARVELSTVKKEEHGTLIGTLASVSEFPVSREGMASLLRNEELVETFSRFGPPYAARINLIPNPAVPSGYRWTSVPGPLTPVSSGTTVRAEVTVREQRPIELVFPLLKKATGVYW